MLAVEHGAGEQDTTAEACAGDGATQWRVAMADAAWDGPPDEVRACRVARGGTWWEARWDEMGAAGNADKG